MEVERRSAPYIPEVECLTTQSIVEYRARWMDDNPALRILCQKLVTWIIEPHHIRTILVPFIVNDEYVSKRLIYWTVSKFAQMNNIQIIQPHYQSNVYEQYTNYLRIYNRRLFDVFCREPYVIDLEMKLDDFDLWKRVMHIDFPDVYEYVNHQCVVRTTVGQLNFFYWASKHGILPYVKTYESTLMTQMKQDSRKRKLEPKVSKKHRHITKSQRTKPSIVILHRPCSIPI